MPQKVPPPPNIANADPALNRWLLELQSILNSSGDIDPSQVAGLAETEAQVTTNTHAIASLETTTGSQSLQITALQSQVTANTNAIATINGQITTLQARNQVWTTTAAPVALHANGDYSVDTTNKHLYVQVAGAWVLII